MVANSASRRCCVTTPSDAPVSDANDDSDVTELLGACALNRPVPEEIEALLICDGVPGADDEVAPDPNRRRVDEKRREGSLLDEEYWGGRGHC